MKKTKITPPPNWEDPPQSFERFERLAKALVAVPKTKLEKELKQRDHKKGKRPKVKNRLP